MGLEKSKIKAGTLRAHLETIEAQRQTSLKEITQLDGAARAYKGAAKSIGQLNVMIQNQLEAGELVMPEDPVALAKQLKLWVTRAQQMALNLADKMTADGLVAQGRMQGIEQTIGVVRKSIEIEEGKAVALESAADNPELASSARTRPVGARPGPSIAAGRKAEDAASRALVGERKGARARSRTRKRVKREGGTNGTDS